MTEPHSPKHGILDRPEILSFVFHPRKELFDSSGGDFEEHLIPVGQDVVVGSRFYAVNSKRPTLIFFHGNGEIVADYSEMAAIYNQMGINFFPVDYRGYGKSTGTPSVSGMIADAHTVFDYAQRHLADKGFTGPLIIMGRSLASASAVELAAEYQDRIDGLIIESGFVYPLPLLQRLGLPAGMMGLSEDHKRREDQTGYATGIDYSRRSRSDHSLRGRRGVVRGIGKFAEKAVEDRRRES